MAEALRRVCQAIPGTQQEAARSVHLSPSTLSAHLGARRKTPLDLEVVKALYAQGEKGNDDGEPLPSWEQLEALHYAACNPAITHCECCDVGRLPEASQEATASAGDQEAALKPAVRQEPPSPENPPVPPAEGDRRVLDIRPSTWPALDDLVEYLKNGQNGDARVLLHSVGTTADPVEFADAVAACRYGGFYEEADALLHHAGGRKQAEVLAIARILHAERLSTDLDVLLAASDA